MKKAEEYLALPYTMTVRWSVDDELYVARVKEIDGCTGHGQTAAKAISMLRDNLEDWIAFSIECGEEVPLPLEENLPSGKWLQRASPRLHQRVMECANDEGVSLNTYVVTCLAEAVGFAKGASSTKKTPAPILGSVENLYGAASAMLEHQRMRGRLSRPDSGAQIAWLPWQEQTKDPVHGRILGRIEINVPPVAKLDATYSTFADFVAGQIPSHSLTSVERSSLDNEENLKSLTCAR